jgi:hypothetical protein
MADCGGLMMGVDIMEPKVPPLEMEKVPPVSVVNAQLAVLAAFWPNSADFLFDVGKAHLVRVAQDGHHQTPRGTDGDTDVEVAVVDDVVAIDARR